MASKESNPRKSFLLRTDPKILEALQKWASDEMRSINGQIEFLLRRALREAGRLKSTDDSQDKASDDPL